MSCYLTMKKNGVIIGEWSRNHPMYEAFDGSNYIPFENEEEFNPIIAMNNAIEELKDSIKRYERLSDMSREFIKSISDEERIWSEICSIKENDDLIAQNKELIIIINFLLEQSDTEDKWTWYMG